MMLISAQLLAQPRRKEHVVEHPLFYRTVQVDGFVNLLSRGWSQERADNSATARATVFIANV